MTPLRWHHDRLHWGPFEVGSIQKTGAWWWPVVGERLLPRSMGCRSEAEAKRQAEESALSIIAALVANSGPE